LQSLQASESTVFQYVIHGLFCTLSAPTGSLRDRLRGPRTYRL